MSPWRVQWPVMPSITTTRKRVILKHGVIGCVRPAMRFIPHRLCLLNRMTCSYQRFDPIQTSLPPLPFSRQILELLQPSLSDRVTNTRRRINSHSLLIGCPIFIRSAFMASHKTLRPIKPLGEKGNFCLSIMCLSIEETMKHAAYST